MYVNVTFLAFQWGELKGFRGLGCCAGALFSDRPIMENPTITTLQLMFFFGDLPWILGQTVRQDSVLSCFSVPSSGVPL